MDAYHIFEEVGRGKHSLVYKGREKQTVQYVAIKSVDKSKLDKVLHEVQLLYRLNHPNILRFSRWYETRHHIWLILEYCTGGSLKELLKHDKRLPENALRVFGTDLVHALHYLHSNGVLFCDLKPSNILLNEYGVLKLCDFALATMLGSDDGDQRKDAGMNAKAGRKLRGTPCYMAPELFGEEGAHSYASDLWSLGCVLYELAMGQLPFFSNTFSELVEMIQTSPLELPVGANKVIGDDTVEFTAQFKNLLRSLLRKDPAKRISWPALLTHEFWGNMPMPNLVPMPGNPAYQEYLVKRKYVPSCPAEDSDEDEDEDEDFAEEDFEHDTLSDSTRLSQVAKQNLMRDSVESSDRLYHARASHSHKENDTTKLMEDLYLEDTDTVLDFDERGELMHEDDPSFSDNDDYKYELERRNHVVIETGSASTADGHSRPHTAPYALTPLEGRTEEDAGFKGEEDLVSSKSSSSAWPAAVGRKTKLRPLTAGPNLRARQGSVQEAAAAILRLEFDDQSDNVPSTPPSPSRSEGVGSHIREEGEEEDEGEEHGVHNDEEESENGQAQAEELTSELPLEAPLADAVNEIQISFQRRLFDRQVEMLVPEDAGIRVEDVKVLPLQYDASDFVVKPIVGHPVNGSLPLLKFSPRSVGFSNLGVAQVGSLSSEDLEQFFSQVFRSMSGTGVCAFSDCGSATHHLYNLLGYLYSLCRNPRLANVIVSSSLLSLLIRLGSKTESFIRHLVLQRTSGGGNDAFLRPLQASPPSTPTRSGSSSSLPDKTLKVQLGKVRVRVAIVIAVLVRHATFIAPRLGDEGLVDLFVSFAQESDPALARYGAAGLGELLFYITTTSPTSPEGSSWKISGSALKQLMSCLESEDEAVRHYAAKTYGNVFTTMQTLVGNGPNARFASRGIVTRLLDMAYREKSESLRSTSATALSQLVRLSPRLLPKLGERGGWDFIVQGLNTKRLCGGVQKAYLNILNLVLCSGEKHMKSSSSINSTLPTTPTGSSNGARATREVLFGRRSQVKAPIIKALVHLVGHTQELVIRGKGVLALALFLRDYPHDFKILIDHRFVPVMDKLCAHLVLQNYNDAETKQSVMLRRSVLFLLLSVGCVVEECFAGLDQTRRKLGAALASGRMIGDSSPEMSLLQRLSRDVLPTLVNITCSRSLQVLTWGPGLISSIARLVQVAAHVKPQSAPDFDRLLFALVEALVSQQQAMLRPEIGAPVVRFLLPALWQHQSRVLMDTEDLRSLRLSAEIVALYLGQDFEDRNHEESSSLDLLYIKDDPADPCDLAMHLGRAVLLFFLRKILPRVQLLLDKTITKDKLKQRHLHKLLFEFLAAAVSAPQSPEAIEYWRRHSMLADKLACLDVEAAALVPLVASVLQLVPGSAFSNASARSLLKSTSLLFDALLRGHDENQHYLVQSCVIVWKHIFSIIIKGKEGKDISISTSVQAVLATALGQSIFHHNSTQAQIFYDLLNEPGLNTETSERLVTKDIDIDDVAINPQLLADTVFCITALAHHLTPEFWVLVRPLARIISEVDHDDIKVAGAKRDLVACLK